MSVGHDVVVIGASTGGVKAVTQLVSELPADLPAAVFVVIHIARDSESVLPRLLNNAGPLEAAHAEDGQRIVPGRIYVAAPDRHLMMKDGHVSVIAGPSENRHRPAIDSLFRSAARVYGARTIGVLLTGGSDDGVAGLRAIKSRGGVALVQDPADAACPDLPLAALAVVDVDETLTLDEIAPAIDRLARAQSPPSQPITPRLEKEASSVELDLETIENEEKVGAPSLYSCPDCGGVLWELVGDDMLRFRCRVGHSYTAHALVEEQGEQVEQALWAAFRSLEEHASFARRLAVRARRSGNDTFANRFLSRAEDAAANAATIRDVIAGLRPQAEAGDDARKHEGPTRESALRAVPESEHKI